MATTKAMLGVLAAKKDMVVQALSQKKVNGANAKLSLAEEKK